MMIRSVDISHTYPGIYHLLEVRDPGSHQPGIGHTDTGFHYQDSALDRIYQDTWDSPVYICRVFGSDICLVDTDRDIHRLGIDLLDNDQLGTD